MEHRQSISARLLRITENVRNAKDGVTAAELLARAIPQLVRDYPEVGLTGDISRRVAMGKVPNVRIVF